MKKTPSVIPAAVKEEIGDRGRFVIYMDGTEAELTYRQISDVLIDAPHTGVPKSLGGRGVGKALVAALFRDAQSLGYKIIPSCPFIAVLAKRNPQWAALTTQG